MFFPAYNHIGILVIIQPINIILCSYTSIHDYRVSCKISIFVQNRCMRGNLPQVYNWYPEDKF